VSGVGGEVFVVGFDFLVRRFEMMSERHWPHLALSNKTPSPRPSPGGRGSRSESVRIG
jgi:hypothetical protein